MISVATHHYINDLIIELVAKLIGHVSTYFYKIHPLIHCHHNNVLPNSVSLCVTIPSLFAEQLRNNEGIASPVTKPILPSKFECWLQLYHNSIHVLVFYHQL